MDMIGKNRRLHSGGKKSEREISRMTGLSCNTTAKWLKAPLEGEPKYRRSKQPGKLMVFHEVLKQALQADGHRPKRERRTMRALYSELKSAGYEGSYSRVTDFVRQWRQGEGQAASSQPSKQHVPMAEIARMMNVGKTTAWRAVSVQSQVDT